MVLAGGFGYDEVRPRPAGGFGRTLPPRRSRVYLFAIEHMFEYPPRCDRNRTEATK